MSEMVFRLGELFCGPGGLATGIKMANVPGIRIEHAWASDYDLDTCNTYIHNICPNEPETVICEDVRKLNIESLGAIDALAFGFPCNDYSIVGEKKGINGNYGPLYSYGVKALKIYEPKWFLAENVSGLQSDNGGDTLKKILKELGACGYDVFPNLYKFEEYGIPQTRHRIIIVGIRKDLKLEYRIPSTEVFKSVDVSCRTALTKPPIPKDALNNELTKQSEVVVKRLSHIKPGQNVFQADLPKNLQLNIKGAKISQIYKRLNPEKPSYTVTGSGGGGTHIYHWKENRALTNRERARLQTFPDDYVFIGSKEKVRRQIGMAVPCKGAKIIAEAIMKTFVGIPYEAMPSNMKI